jgi:O-antigen/teichoic acid export membrane protein
MRDKLFYIGRRFLKHELITGSFFIFIGAILSGFLAFVLNLFFARSLTTVDYGIYASLLSLFTLAIIPAQSISVVMIKFATDYLHKDKQSLAIKFYKKAFRALIAFSFIILILFLIFSIPIKLFLKIDNLAYVMLIGVAICFNYVAIPNDAYIKSLLKFSFASFSAIASATVRLIGGVIFILLGFKVFGALGAILLSILTAFLLGFIPIKFLFSKETGEKDNISVREIVNYALPACISILALTSLTSMDVILVKHFFNPTQAGFYGGLSLIGKVIFYFTSVIPSVMFPLVVKRNAKGESIASLFYLAIFLVTIPSVAITSFYYLFPSFSINFFLGKNYMSILPYLGIFGIYITIFSILNVCVNFFLSIGKTKIFIPVIIATILQIILIYIFHNSFFQVIGVSLGVSSILLAYLLIVFAKDYMNFKDIRSSLSLVNGPSL